MTTIKRLLLVIGVSLALLSVPLAGCSPSDSGQASSSSASSSAAVSSQAQSSESAKSEAGEITVSVEVDASAAAEEKVDISKLKSIEGPKDYELESDATAYDALVATGATLDGDPSYVTSINGLAAGDAGSTSGWMYEVNEEMPTVAANEYALGDGDSVRWYYVTKFE